MSYYNGKKIGIGVYSSVEAADVDVNKLIDGSISEIKSKVMVIRYSAFSACHALAIADFSSVREIREQAFFKAYDLKALVLRDQQTVAQLYSIDALQDTKIYNKSGFIYVPRKLVSSYQNATNWSFYGAVFRPLEDYTVDGTADGDLDPSRI